MKKISFLVTALTVISVAFTSCKKDDGDDEPVKTPEKTTAEKLTLGGWITTSGTVTPPLFGTSDWFAEYAPCEKDDVTTFKAGGVLTLDEGATKCNASDPQVYSTGTWSLAADNKTITVTEDGSTYTYVIQSITETSMTVTQTEVFSGTTYTSTISFKH